jgi:cobalt-zinc-cadmium efflux system protein
MKAFRRIGNPPKIDGGPMLAVAFAGLLADAASAWVLMRGGVRAQPRHARRAASRGARYALLRWRNCAGIVMLAAGWYLADPIISAGIGLLILHSAWRLLSESLNG